MKKIYMKVHSYNSNTQSITVSYASDASANTVENYPKYVFDCHNFKGNNTSEILKALVRNGKSIVESQESKEKNISNNDIAIIYNPLINQIISYDINDLYPQTTQSELVNNLTDVTNS